MRVSPKSNLLLISLIFIVQYFERDFGIDSVLFDITTFNHCRLLFIYSERIAFNDLLAVFTAFLAASSQLVFEEANTS